jgi:hypothetical protein
MKLSKRAATIAGLAFAAAILTVPVDTEAQGMMGRGQGRGGTSCIQGGMSTILANLPMQELSAEEEIGITKMREEEKLARDVYTTLYNQWQLPVFAKINQSEQHHMDTIKLLLDKYDRPDPVTDNSTGIFTNPEMQGLYNTLVEQGGQSAVEALKVGATIEDLDIKDLYDLLAQTDNTDIKTIYQNLAKGSRNHLRAFTGQLAQLGITYEAQFLTQQQIDDIITSARERGQMDAGGNLVTGRGGYGNGYGRGMGRRFQ